MNPEAQTCFCTFPAMYRMYRMYKHSSNVWKLHLSKLRKRKRVKGRKVEEKRRGEREREEDEQGGKTRRKQKRKVRRGWVNLNSDSPSDFGQAA